MIPPQKSHCHFCLILFVRSELTNTSPPLRQEKLVSSFWKECQRICGYILNYHSQHSGHITFLLHRKYTNFLLKPPSNLHIHISKRLLWYRFFKYSSSSTASLNLKMYELKRSCLLPYIHISNTHRGGTQKLLCPWSKRGNRTYSGVHSSSEIPPGQSSMFLYYDSVLFLTGPDDVTWGEPALDMQFVFLPQALPHSVRVHPSLYMQAPSSHT